MLLLVAKQLNVSPFNGYNLYITNDKLRFFLGTTTNNDRIQGTSVTISNLSDGNWHHAALTYDGFDRDWETKFVISYV